MRTTSQNTQTTKTVSQGESRRIVTPAPSSPVAEPADDDKDRDDVDPWR
jgi:hypothetical protein